MVLECGLMLRASQLGRAQQCGNALEMHVSWGLEQLEHSRGSSGRLQFIV
jgi:hypothetical protein